MAINFPDSPADGATHTDGVIQWVFNATNKSWTVTNSSNISLQNGTDLDNTIVVLDRISGQNLLAPGTGLTFDPSLRSIKIVANGSQTSNLLELRSNVNALLNGFNERGVLINAGRVFFTDVQPTPNINDTGLLWYNTSDSNLYVWKGATGWVIAAGGVTLTDNQTISGAKTFSGNIFLSSTAKISGQGASKTIDLAPTDGSSVAANALSLSSTQATFSVPVEFSAVGTTAKTAVVTIADAQTITSTKTFTNNIRLNGGDTSILVDTSTDGGTTSNDLTIRANMSTDGRFLKIWNNANVLKGITIRPKNKDNIGSLTIEGPTTIDGNLAVTGTISGGSVAAVTTVYGQLKSSAGTATENVDTVPPNLSGLTFLKLTGVNPNDSGFRVTNTGTSSASFYCRREITSTAYTYVIHKVSLNAGTSVDINSVTGPAAAAGVTITVVGGKIGNQVFTLTGSNLPITYTFTLAP